MAYYSLHAYDADVWIPRFRGLSQSDIMMTPDMQMAAEAENVETPNGVLQPQAACPFCIGEFDSRVETIASFHRRWYEGENKDWYVCCVAGKFYQRQARTEQPWQEIELPETVTAFGSSVWSWVTYEINPDNSTDTVDVLLMSNQVDGMIMIVPPDRPTTWGDTKEHTWGYLQDMTWVDALTPKWTIVRVTTCDKNFGAIERFGERIWGTDIPDNPDMLMYSAPYDATDWTANTDIPEDGAGEILQPSWDGDRFHAIRRFGDQLLAFKKNKIWKISGITPSEFRFSEQYGRGTAYFNTIVVDNEKVFMCTEDGVCVYDGMSTSPYAQKNVEAIWKIVNRQALDQMCAVMYKNRYYLAFPTGDSEVNNAMLVYNFDEGTILYYPDFSIEAFMPTDDTLFATSSSQEGKIICLRYDSWTEGMASGAPTKWVTPWMDFGYKRIAKGGFELYFVPEVQNEEVTLKFSVQTEKKTKTKYYTIKTLPEGKTEHKGKRLHFSGNGRKFRVIIETEEGVTAPWRLIGGIQMIVETDPD